MREPIIFDTNDAAVRLQMEQEMRDIEALPAVRQLLQLSAGKTTGAGFQVTLRCFAGREHGGCGKKSEPPVLLTNSRTTLLACLQELRMRLEKRHGGACVAAAEAARAAEAKAQQEAQAEKGMRLAAA